MPTYQYACTNPECGNRFELVQSFTDPAASACPVCGGAVRKVFSAVGVVFKGSGFYRNDSRETAGKAAAKSNGSSESSGDSAAAAKSTPASESSSGDSSSKAPAAASASSDKSSSKSGASGSSGVAAASA
jgi:putative FmdB family regulatory protein